MNETSQKDRKTNQRDPLENLILDPEEQALEEALARGEFQPTPDTAQTRKFFQQAAENYRVLQQSKRITLRVNQLDLIRVKAKAKDRGLPYQTLLNVLIRQYAQGKTQIEI